jgi:CheY-like chemotaxis protein
MADAGRSMRMVFADDDPAVRRLLRRLLEIVPQLEIVGEAGDGSEAVALVQSTHPDVVLLDVDMPRLDGVSAAELIFSYYPQTRVLVHSAGASEDHRARVAALGLSILEKSLLRDTVGLVEVMAAEPRPVIEPLVLLALADHDGDGVLIVGADESIPFYNGIAAAMLHLPVPAQRLSLSTLRDLVRVIDEHEQRSTIDQLPLVRALSARAAISATVACEFIDDGSRGQFVMASLPFFSPHGEFIVVGNYLAVALG